MAAIKYIFWDSDNTLIDTFALHWAKHVNVLKKQGIVLGENHKRRIHENNGLQNWHWLSAEMGLALPEQDYLNEIDAWYISHAADLKFIEGVEEALQYFQDRGCRQCVVSNGRRNSVVAAHETLGTTRYFEFLLCKEDYEGRKPDPAPFLTAMLKMAEIVGHAVKPEECLAIDDDPLGVESAKHAGMTTIFRPTDLVEQTSGFADYTVKTKEEFLEVIRTSLRA